MSKKILFPLLFIMMGYSHSAMALCLGCTCSVGLSTISFGIYNPILTTPAAATGNITVSCFSLVGLFDIPYTITLGKGISNTYHSRTMTNGVGNINYNIFTTPARNVIWGDATSGTSSVAGAASLIAIAQTLTVNHPVYGSILANQPSVKPGSYTDTMTLTVTY